MSQPLQLPPMQVACAVANELGEGVLWCERAQALYWTDIQRSMLYRLHPASDTLEHWALPERLASFALCETDGWLLLALATRLAFFCLADGRLQELHTVEPGFPTRSNDGACDRQGRFVFGTLHEPASGEKQEPVGAFWRLHADLALERLALPGVGISNSLAFSPDGATMYFCDSLSPRIYRCSYGETLGAPQVFVELDKDRGAPDGSCVDADGSLWNAQWGLGRVVCYGADGAVRRVLPLAARQPTRPAFGGADLGTLYVTSAREGLEPSALARQPQAGALFSASVDVKGLPEPRFTGAPAA